MTTSDTPRTDAEEHEVFNAGANTRARYGWKSARRRERENDAPVLSWRVFIPGQGTLKFPCMPDIERSCPTLDGFLSRAD